MTHLFNVPPSADLSPASYSEPHFAYLARSGRPSFARVRTLVEDWLAAVPKPHRSELASRLRTTEDHHFEAAFFELYLHELCRRLGYHVTCHPRAGTKGRRPDFFMRSPHTRFLIEAATLSASNRERAEESRRSVLIDALNSLDCPDYFLRIEHVGTLKTPPSLRQLRHDVRRFLANLEYDAVREAVQTGGIESAPAMTFRHGDFRLRLSAIPVGPQHRADSQHMPVGILCPGEAYWVDDRTPLREKVREKASRYGRLRRPLIVAVNAANTHLRHEVVMEALFGSEALRLRWDTGGELLEPEPERRADGAWIGPRGPRHRTVSAVLIVSSLLPWSVAACELVVYHNPWARYPIGVEALPFAQFVPEGNRLVGRAGKVVREILDLPASWPGLGEEGVPASAV